MDIGSANSGVGPDVARGREICSCTFRRACRPGAARDYHADDQSLSTYGGIDAAIPIMVLFFLS